MDASRVLLIETRGPHAGPGCAAFLADGAALAAHGSSVRVLLLGDAVTAAVADAVPEIASLIEAGAEVAVDETSVERRGMSHARLFPGVTRTSLERAAAEVVDKDVKVVWH